ncbi:MAG: S8 family peptidase, partial [Cyanobacteriota bacterium]|nr:S8 family peptidase [Cyanobacteriota bacterium]
TGITQVPDLQQTQFVRGYDFVNDRVAATDDVGHGTHVAGTIAQSTNNNFGVAGIAHEAKIMPIKVLGQGGGTVADIAEGIRFAADNGADVINMSLGGSGESKLLEEAVNYAYDKGVVVIAAAGNENRNSASYPARYPRVISVSALDSGGKKAPYSNFGAGVDLSAPGGSDTGKILQHTIDPQTGEAVFAGYQGTSMAAPHVAGVAALIKASGNYSPEEVLNILKQSSRKMQEDPLNHYGAGQLDAGAAVKLALKGQITFKDFFRWLRDNGYLNLRFWIDGGVVALLPKILMVLGSYLLAFLLRNYFPFAWSWSLAGGLLAGSSGLFFLRGFYIFDLPQWPFRVLGSSLPEMGNAIQGGTMLNPIFASALIPAGLVVLFLGHSQWKWFAIGTTLGVASCLGVYAFLSPAVWGLGTGWLASGFLAVNALLCFGLANLASQPDS